MNTHTKTVAQVASELGLTVEEIVGPLSAIGVHRVVPTTALADADIQELTARVKPWGQILAHATNDGPATPPLRIEKRDGGAITLDRAWDAQEKGLVWTKTHKPTTGKRAEDRLSFLCEWENTLLKRATFVGVKRCAHVIEDHFKNSPVHMGDTPIDQRHHRISRVRTLDAGPTLDVWRLMRPRVEGRPQAHPFVQQCNYLQLVQGILLALEEFHDNGFVHLDLHPGNIALPARVTTQSASLERGERILLEPLWNDIRLIDLDFSACQKISPLARLPHELKDGVPAAPMSDHLRLRLLAIDDWLKYKNLQDRCWDQAFFAKRPQADLLDCFLSLDWREDLYQLGYWLAHIRDRWGGAAHVLTKSDHNDVSDFIKTFPEDLMKWGGDEQIRWDPVSRSNTIPTPPLPHRDYIDQIDSLLLQLPGAPKYTVLHRVDHDLGYGKRLALEVAAHDERQRRLLEQERRDQSLLKLEEKLATARAGLTKKRLPVGHQTKEQETPQQADQIAQAQHHDVEFMAHESATREQQLLEAKERELCEQQARDEEKGRVVEAVRLQAEDVERQQLEKERHLREVAEAEEKKRAHTAIDSTGPKQEAASVASGTEMANTRSGQRATMVLATTIVVGATGVFFWVLSRWTPFVEGALLRVVLGGLFSLGVGFAFFSFRERRFVASMCKAAAGGGADSMLLLGDNYNYGRGGLPKDKVQAEAWFRKAAEAGQAIAMYRIGCYYVDGRGGLPKDEIQATAWLRKAAEAGYAEGMWALGVFYSDGRGGLPMDEVRAEAWFRKAAEAGKANAMHGIGVYYAAGRGGLPKDEVQAEAWFRKAAEAGNSAGMLALGIYYVDGHGGLPKDKVQAEAWFRKAAELGSTPAAEALAGMTHIEIPW